ncbi:AbrB family transcriptional regulator [Jiella endophytica]|uniref:AbrB family transcriptional regulator n=1 Tax=Jiella endophytica TaxID=2558362 RepID=A0A4Y8RUV3_9HYPH|nr:AbrB family transcriptional regulator [Jiella endophytica]TFF27587.1 AbrB family transcriptional regulator [Jiella endophytica]
MKPLPPKPTLRFTPGEWPAGRRWAVLILASLAVAGGLECLDLPAALLLGPMLAAIVMASRNGTVAIPRILFLGAQGIVGIMIAGNLPLSLFGEIATDWPIFLAGTASTFAAACLLGWLLSQSDTLPGTTAIWGSSPGAATAMTLMSEDYGADMRLVAFMQYTRVAACALVATVLARALGASAPGHAAAWMPSAAVWLGSLLPFGLALSGAALGVVLKIPGGALLTPMAIGIAAKLAFGLDIALPMPVLAVSYALLGWGIGMRFTAKVLADASRVFARVLLSIVLLLAGCAVFAGLLVLFAGIDPLTAYLATSPGGADSVAIIAASTNVDVPFIMAMQVARFLLVLVAGPPLARLLSLRQARMKSG